MTTRLEQITNVAMLVVCLLLSVLVGERLWNERFRSGVDAAEPQDVESQNLRVQLDGRAAEGNGDAKLVLVEFSDFECPFCGAYARETYPELQRDYIETGKVRRVFRNFPLPNHQHAVGAAKAAECAGREGRYWEMHHRLFVNQGALANSDTMRYASALGLDESAFSRCLEDSLIEAAIKSDQAEGHRLKVASTPTFFIGVPDEKDTVRLLRRIAGAQPYSVFKSALDELSDGAPTR